MNINKASKTIFKVLALIENYPFLLTLSLLLAAVSVVLQLYVPILFGEAIDYVIGKGKVDFNSLTGFLRQIALAVFLSSLASFVMNLINNKMAYSVVEDIRSRVLKQVQKLPLSYLDRRSTGDVLSRIISDADILADGLMLGFSQLFSGVVTIIITLVFMFIKSPVITAVVLFLTPVSFFVARFISKQSYQMFKKQGESRGEETALIEEMIGNQKIVRAFGYEKTSFDKFKKINDNLREYSKMAMFYSSLTNPSTRAVNSVVYAIVALVGALKIMGGKLSVGGLAVLLSYANQYMKPFNDISDVATELQNALACADRLFELIEAETEASSGDKELEAPKGYVNIDNISFSYIPEKKLIENFSLDVKPGMKIAIVGPTGCGKTTLINLLMRFYDCNSGIISLDGENIYAISRRSLRKSYGMVLQDTWLENASVRDNINIGKPNATDDEIIEAAKKAYSWGFVRRLPSGLDSILTDESLSQGQKQLLCITRVMLALPPMLILDEATSSIDTRTEMNIQAAFNALMEGRTSFIVAHRLSTIRNADIILVMKDGHIIEQGSHNNLIEAKGFYAKLYNSQFAVS